MEDLTDRLLDLTVMMMMVIWRIGGDESVCVCVCVVALIFWGKRMKVIIIFYILLSFLPFKCK